ncbi:MAG: transcriptional repressor [Rhodospirillaceae bacterium]|nr:transcriptional repressor [Rhodospirillaceae bacterium]MCA8933757.1 transcriptional repressor [Rhodospirillaceae bacterium]
MPDRPQTTQHAMTRAGPGRLGKNDRAVLDLLNDADAPMRAYEILDALRPQGVRAPPQVYRALNRLVADGRVHRIDSLNAFIACDHPGHPEIPIFLICRTCGVVRERHDPPLVAEMVRRCGSDTGFRVEEGVLEMRGLCQVCR